MVMNKQYLGDSVYVEREGYDVVLTTENGYPDDPSNRIVLDPSVYAALWQYIDKMHGHK